MAVPVISRRSFPVFDAFAGLSDWPGTRSSGADLWVPAADIEETDAAWLVELDVPGVAKDDVDVEVHGRRLSVTGERKDPERDGTLRRRGRIVGKFEYAVRLGADVDSDDVTAELTDGVLTVRVPKSASSQPRKIDVS